MLVSPANERIQRERGDNRGQEFRKCKVDLYKPDMAVGTIAKVEVGGFTTRFKFSRPGFRNPPSLLEYFYRDESNPKIL